MPKLFDLRCVGLLLVIGGSLLVSPQPTLAAPLQLSYTLDSYGFSSFQTLIAQAESTAAAAVEQAFLGDPTATEVMVMVLGERNGQVVPLLSTTVSRTQWQQEPSVRAWTTYYERPAIALLGFLQPQIAQQPAVPQSGFISRSTRSQLEDVPGDRDD
jgi:hypothetical protein